jgi:hypothetical protein
MPPPGLFDNSNRGSNLAQRYAQPGLVGYNNGPDQFLPPLKQPQPQQNFQTMDMQQQHHALHQQQQQQANHMRLPPMSPPPGHLNMGPAMPGGNNMPPSRPSMMGQQPQGMPLPHMQQHHHGLNQPPPPCIGGGMHMNPGLVSQHQMAMQQQQQIAMARQQQQQRGGFVSHGNPNEAGMRFGGMPPSLQHGPMGVPPDLGLFGNTNSNNESRGLFQQHGSTGHNLPSYHHQHQNDLNSNDKGGILPPGGLSGMSPASRVGPTNDILPRASSKNSQEESNLIDSLFATTTTGESSSLLAGLQGLSVGGDGESGWEASGVMPGWSQEKSRLPAAMQQQNESRFQWGS